MFSSGRRRPSRERSEYIERCKANQQCSEQESTMPSENLLLVDAMCPEVSQYPVFCFLIDLDKAHGGYVDITVDRDKILSALGKLAS